MAKRAPGASDSRGVHRSGAAGDRGAAGELQRAGEWAGGFADSHAETHFVGYSHEPGITSAGDHITISIPHYTRCECVADAPHSHLNTVPVTVSNGGPANRDSNAATPEYGDRRISGPRNEAMSQGSGHCPICRSLKYATVDDPVYRCRTPQPICYAGVPAQVQRVPPVGNFRFHARCESPFTNKATDEEVAEYWRNY